MEVTVVEHSTRATEIILVDENRREVLLGRRRTDPLVGQIIGFGGKVEQGESAVNCILRETYEEARVRVDRKTLRHIGVLRTARGFGNFNVQLYLATAWRGTPKKTKSMAPVWIALHGPYPEDMPEEMQLILQAIVSKKYNIRVSVDGTAGKVCKVDITAW